MKNTKQKKTWVMCFWGKKKKKKKKDQNRIIYVCDLLLVIVGKGQMLFMALKEQFVI